eukprot:Skav228889  [mRNA]  locus=scaffold194:159578:160057:+ [translate_table: standard]
MAAPSTVPEETWTVVGYVAWSNSQFELAKEESAQGEIEQTMHSVHKFLPSLMSAVWDLRKTSVRVLGGTLSSSIQPRKKGLKDSIVLGDMIKVLTEPNFVIFKLLTKENVPSLLAANMLEVAGGEGGYCLVHDQNPFFPESSFLKAFKLVAKQLSSTKG